MKFDMNFSHTKIYKQSLREGKALIKYDIQLFYPLIPKKIKRFGN